MKSIIGLAAPSMASASLFEKSISGFSESELRAYDSTFISYEAVSHTPEASCFGDVLTVVSI